MSGFFIFTCFRLALFAIRTLPNSDPDIFLLILKQDDKEELFKTIKNNQLQVKEAISVYEAHQNTPNESRSGFSVV